MLGSKSRHISPLVKWQSFPVLYYLNNTVPTNLIDGITDSFDTFNNAAEFIFYQRTWNENDSDIDVSFRNIDGNKHTVAMADWYPSLNPYEMSNATIVFDNSEEWDDVAVSNDSNVYDIQEVATHEVGHVSGLAHADDSMQTMYYKTELGETQRRTLNDEDRAAFKIIYDIH
jgi:predicted Zn-dependent protease